MLADVAEAVPYAHANAFQRAVRRTASTAPAAWALARGLPLIDRPLARIGVPRLQRFISAAAGLPMVVLTTTGARSGQPRTLPLLSVPLGDGELMLVGSNFGQDRNPAWVHNLRAHPDCTVDLAGVTGAYVAREVSGAERERVWDAGVALYPGWAAYARRTARAAIPVFVLTPARPESAEAIR
jgi:deazaflavin-dependent oxidoreductase (nitroreductase family)